MGGPAELADGLDPVEPITAGDQHRRVAGEGGGIAGDCGDQRDRRGGEQRLQTELADDHDIRVGRKRVARLMRALAWGTTTCEAKTGYALSVEGNNTTVRVLRLR